MNDPYQRRGTPEPLGGGTAAADMRANGMLIVVRPGDAGDKAAGMVLTNCGPYLPLGAAKLRARGPAGGLPCGADSVQPDRAVPSNRGIARTGPTAADRARRALGVHASPAQVRAVFFDRGLHNAVLCTHGETISRLFEQLTLDGLRAEEPLHWPKGSIWLLWHTKRDIRARFLPPLALDPVLLG
jgi:hypothetical protein